MGFDLISSLLAGFLDKFKASNPVLFIIIASVLTAAQYALESGVLPVDPTITKWVLWVAAIFLGTRTNSFLTKNG